MTTRRNDKDWTFDGNGADPEFVKYNNQDCTTANARLWRDGEVFAYKMDGDRLAFGTWGSYCEKKRRGTDGKVKGLTWKKE